MTITETDPSKLPQWRPEPDGKSHPVPWVTAWSGQESKEKPQVVQRPGGRPAWTYRDPLEFRDTHRVLWQREGANRVGRPLFKVVSTYRQRTCMLRAKCQVCGDDIASKTLSSSIPWLVDETEWKTFVEARESQSPVLTVTTPVCPDCIPLATRLCPNLVRTGWRLLRVDRYEIWGVWGRVLINNSIQFDMVPYAEKFQAPLTLAHQQVAELVAYEEIKEWA